MLRNLGLFLLGMALMFLVLLTLHHFALLNV